MRFFALASIGVNVTGVDIEQPTLSVRDVGNVLVRNGWYRMLKGAIRAAVFDRRLYSDFRRFLMAEYGAKAEFSRNQLVIADSADPEFWSQYPGPFGFVYSEDVFEHIPRESLRHVVSQMAESMSVGAVALVRPMVFTGICGGHHIDWYSGTLIKNNSNRTTPPWDHLLENRYEADTYLNKLTRRDYRQLFERHFEVLEDKSVREELGSEFLTTELRSKLSQYDEYELFSNSVLFVLRKR